MVQKLLEKNNGNLSGKKIGIFLENSNSEADFNRREGVCDTLKGTGAEIVWTVSRDEEIKRNTTLQSQRKVDIVLALDDTSMEQSYMESVTPQRQYIILTHDGQNVSLFQMNLLPVINVLPKQ